jgi:hypothetical protein
MTPRSALAARQRTCDPRGRGVGWFKTGFTGKDRFNHVFTMKYVRESGTCFLHSILWIVEFR